MLVTRRGEVDGHVRLNNIAQEQVLETYGPGERCVPGDAQAAALECSLPIFIPDIGSS